MNRKEFFDKAKKHGHDPKKKMTAERKQNFRQELIDHFNSDQGKKEIEKAPLWLREKPVEEIVLLLMQEVD